MIQFHFISRLFEKRAGTSSVMMISGTRFRIKYQFSFYCMAVEKTWGEDCILCGEMLYFTRAWLTERRYLTTSFFKNKY